MFSIQLQPFCVEFACTGNPSLSENYIKKYQLGNLTTSATTGYSNWPILLINCTSVLFFVQHIEAFHLVSCSCEELALLLRSAAVHGGDTGVMQLLNLVNPVFLLGVCMD